MLFGEARVLGILKNMESAKFVPPESASKYEHYIWVTRLCMYKDDLIPFVDKMNRSYLVTGNKSNIYIASVNLSARQVTSLHPW